MASSSRPCATSSASVRAGAGVRHGVPSFESFDEMLASVRSDVVALCTPSGLHPKHGILAARAGKHVVCEKPMAISLEAADELVAECDAAGVQLFVVKQNRLNPAIQLLKRAIDRERFGRIYLANTTVRWTRPQDYYDQAPWRGTWEFDGGAIMNQASHYVDLIQWLLGPVESVMAKTATLARRIETEDTGVAVLRFRSGALGVIEVTMLTYPRNLEGSITILGEKGTVKVGGTAVNRVEHWTFADYDDDDKLVESADDEPADGLRIRPRGILPQRARGPAWRGESRDRRPCRPQVARADSRDLRVREDGPGRAASARLPDATDRPDHEPFATSVPFPTLNDPCLFLFSTSARSTRPSRTRWCAR